MDWRLNASEYDRTTRIHEYADRDPSILLKAFLFDAPAALQPLLVEAEEDEVQMRHYILTLHCHPSPHASLSMPQASFETLAYSLTQLKREGTTLTILAFLCTATATHTCPCRRHGGPGIVPATPRSLLLTLHRVTIPRDATSTLIVPS